MNRRVETTTKKHCWAKALCKIVCFLRQRLRYLFLLCLCLFSLFRKAPIISIAKTGTSFKTKKQEAVVPNEETKYILYYTPYWAKKDFQFGVGHQPFLDYQCPVHNCVAHANYHGKNYNMTNQSQYDAVLFSAQFRDFPFSQDVRDAIASWRKPHQRFVFVMMEAQSYYIDHLQDMDSFFNWTMTYKWDSDIPRPYGWFQPAATQSSNIQRLPPPVYATKPDRWIPYDEADFRSSLLSRDKYFHALARRPGKLAWIVSHCDTDSLREDYIFQLKQYVQVDQFGKCGGPTCDVPYSITQADNCTRHVEGNYKFYLSFENQFCNDYVTEKFFRRIDKSLVVVFGQANYSKIAPPHSFVNVFDFDSAKDLADHLHELDRDDEKYLSYFWWKDHYQVQHPYSGGELNNFGRSMCHLCEKLHDSSLPNNVYDNMYDWWRRNAECGKRMLGLKGRMANDQNIPGVRRPMKYRLPHFSH